MADNLPQTLNIESHFSSLQTDPLRDFKFIVLIPHKVRLADGSVQNIRHKLGFTSVDGLNASTNAIPYRMGGMNTTVQQVPGQTTYNPISLQRGLLLGTKQMYFWWQQLFSVQVGEGQYVGNDGAGFRSEIDIYVMPHPRTDTKTFQPVAHFRVFNAWPSGISYSTLNAGDNGLIVEQMTLVHEGWTMPHLGSPDAPFGGGQS